MSCKIFRDSVHGYISVPSDYCKHIVDNEYFQRLRRIEQTSVRVLYPSARHDRFVHSLGTFHLGSIAVGHLVKNSEDLIKKLNISSDFILRAVESFKVACLLHDCGHTPFSHIFEKEYNGKYLQRCIVRYLSCLNLPKQDASNFIDDLVDTATPKEHEMISALIVLKVFKKKFEDSNFNVDIILICRMILGRIILKDHKSPKISFQNALIKLLNSNIIDVDKLDYILRDKWAAGYSSSSLDVDRLLSSLCFKEGKGEYDHSGFVLCFYKSALSVIQLVLDMSNFERFWVINHHKAIYDQHILKKAVSLLPRIYSSKKQHLFSLASFFRPVIFGTNHCIFLPSDDDLVHLMKTSMSKNDFAKEWLSREHKLIPVWKTYSEFKLLFKNVPDRSLKKGGLLDQFFEDWVKSFLNENNYPKDSCCFVPIKELDSYIDKNQIYVAKGDASYECYNNFQIPSMLPFRADPFYYIYFSKDLIEEARPKFIEYLISRLRS